MLFALKSFLNLLYLLAWTPFSHCQNLKETSCATQLLSSYCRLLTGPRGFLLKPHNFSRDQTFPLSMQLQLCWFCSVFCASMFYHLPSLPYIFQLSCRVITITLCSIICGLDTMKIQTSSGLTTSWRVCIKLTWRSWPIVSIPLMVRLAHIFAIFLLPSVFSGTSFQSKQFCCTANEFLRSTLLTKCSDLDEVEFSLHMHLGEIL